MRKTICFILVLCSYALHAQEGSPYVFTHFKRKDGLASDRVFHVAQDKDGFIWIATDNGLQRYDGHRFITIRYNPSRPDGLPSDIVALLHTDSKGRLWVVAGPYVGILDRSTLRFTEVALNLPASEKNKGIRKFYEDKQGNIMLFVSKQFVTYHEGKKEFALEHNFIKVPPDWKSDDLLQDPQTGKYWIGGKGGLLLYDPQVKKYSAGTDTLANNPILKRFANITHVHRMFIDKQGRFWVSSWVPFSGAPQLYCYDAKTDSLYKRATPVQREYHEIWGIVGKEVDNFWMYGYGLMLEYNPFTHDFRQAANKALKEHTIEFDFAAHMFVDRDKNFWVCTNNGLFLFNPKAQLFSSISNRRPGDSLQYDNRVTAVIETRNRQVWAATWGAGIFSYDSKLQPIPNELSLQNPEYSKLQVWSMMHRSNGEVWIGLPKGNILIHQPGNKAVELTSALFGGSTIRQIMQDRHGHIWIGTEAGHVIRWLNGNRGDTVNAPQLMQKLTGRIMKFYEDKPGNIWVVTDIYGVYKLSSTGKQLAHYDEKSGQGKQLFHSMATDILQLNDSLMLIANNAISMLNVNTNRITHITTADGLPANQVINLSKDKAGYLWIGLANGLCRYNFEKKVFSTFDVRNGILSENFEVSASTFLSDGRLAMGTSHDLLVFDPEEVLRQNNSTDVKITDVALFGRSLPIDSLMGLPKMKLTNSENSITINYSVLSYLDQNKITYYHMLEGLETDWVRSENHQAVYNYLPPGRYRFRVRCMNGNGVMSEKDTMLNIRVMPPFWQTWWFALLVAAAIGAIAYSYYFMRRKQKDRLEQIRERIATDLHDDMGSTLSSIRIFSDVVKSQIGDNRPQAVSMLEKISINASQLSENMQDIIWTIKRDHDRLEDLVARMREFGLKLCDAKDIAFKLQVSDSFRTSRLNLEERRNLYLIFKEALNNSVKYSGCSQVSLFITQQGKRLKMVIEDNGKGFSEATVRKGNGLNNINKRALEVNGFARIESAEGKGTRIDVLIKLN